MKIKYIDLMSAIDHIKKTSNGGDISISIGEYGSFLELSYWTTNETDSKIKLYESSLEKFATKTETDNLKILK